MNQNYDKDEEVTLESLARMVQKGFSEMAKQVDLEIIKRDVAYLKADVKEMGNDIKHLDKRMDRVEDALGLGHPVRK